jgi:hypothetical protein
MQQRIHDEPDRYSNKTNSSTRSTAIKRLADYCKQFSVTADIVMDTDELINTHPEKWYEDE